MEYDERFFVQPGEMKIVDSFGNILTDEEANKYLEKRKKDMEEKLKIRGIEKYLRRGMVVQVGEAEDLYLVTDRFVYDENYVLYDYKITEYEKNSGNSYLINHEQVEKAFILRKKAK